MITFNQYLAENIRAKFVVISRVSGDLWKINHVTDDKKEALTMKKDMFVQSKKASDKAVVDGKFAKKNKWKLYGMVEWDGKSGKVA